MTISDVVIHVNESLNPQSRHELEDQMRTIDGVIAPRFNERTPHLMIVAYNADNTNAHALLDGVRHNGYSGQVVGGFSI